MKERSNQDSKNDVFSELLDDWRMILKQQFNISQNDPRVVLEHERRDWRNRWRTVCYYGGPLEDKPPPDAAFYEGWEECFRELGKSLLAWFSDFHLLDLRIEAADQNSPVLEYGLVILERACDSTTNGQIADALHQAYERRMLVDLRFGLEAISKKLFEMRDAEWPPWTPEMTLERLVQCANGMPDMSERTIRRSLQSEDGKWQSRGTPKKKRFRHADTQIQAELLRRIRADRNPGHLGE